MVPVPRSRETTRSSILQAAYEQFYREGFNRSGVDAIADAAGVTKRTLYDHFESKDALLTAVLDHQHGLVLERIERWADRSATDAVSLIDGVFASVAAWTAQPGWQGSGFSRVAVELSSLPGHPARTATRRHKAAVEAWYADRFRALEVDRPELLAREVMLLLEGCFLLLLVHGDPAYVATAAAAARHLAERETD